MIVTCPSCNKQHKVDESRIPAGGIRAKCSGCSHRLKIEPPSGEQTTCPNCGHSQPKSEECARCGVIFSKFKAKIKPKKTPIKQEGEPQLKMCGSLKPAPSEPMDLRTSIKGRHAALIIAAIIILPMLYGLLTGPSDTTTASSTSRSSMEVGIRSLKGNQPACTTLEAFKKLAEYSHDKNYNAINRMILNGQAWMTKEGKRVRVVQSKLLSGAAKVREIETGKVYWVAYEAIVN